MNTEKLRVLLQAIQEGSLTAAAEKMHFTPSGISRAVESLEREMEMKLLSRTKTGVKPTAACEILLPEIKRLLLDEAVLMEHARELAAGETGTIRIGTAYAALYPWLAKVMASFHEMYPGVQYDMKYGYSSELLEMTAANRIDFCIVSERNWQGNWSILLQDELVALLPPDHRYAHAESVPIGLFGEEPYIDVHPEQETDNRRLLEFYKIQPQKYLSTEDSSAMYSMVEAGLGIGLNNRINTKNYQGNVCVIPLDPPQYLNIGVAYSEPGLPVVKEFIDYIGKCSLT